MGGGSWTAKAFDDYSYTTRGVSSEYFATMDNLSANQVYTAFNLTDALNPLNIVRECRDSAEHPNSFPIILALDVTGSMGDSAVRVNQKLGELIQQVLDDKTISDPEFCSMAIGDLAYDMAPIQMSQFESDVRIAEQMDHIYFESGGGGNTYESYTAAWYMGARHTDCDCWKHGNKGLIITLGDECPNPYLPRFELNRATGDKVQEHIETKMLLPEVQEKFEVYHLSVSDRGNCYESHNRRHNLDEKWSELLGDHYKVVTLDNLIPTIVEIIKEVAAQNNTGNYFTMGVDFSPVVDENNEITW